jgi:hypothetical protein
MKAANMEDFADRVDTVDCKAPRISISFKKAEDIADITTEWNWVNEKAGNSIVLFVNHAACGEDGSRVPFKVTGAEFDRTKLRAELQVVAVQEIESVVADGVLEIDTLVDPAEVLPPRSVAAIDKRASVTKSLSLNRDLSGNIFKVQKNGNFVSLDCTDCGTRGYLIAKAYVDIARFRVKTAYVEFKADDVEVRVDLKLEAHVAHHVTNHKVIVPLLVQVGIPHIIALRFGANLGLGWDIDFQANGTATWGIVGKLADSQYRNCLKGCNDINQG